MSSSKGFPKFADFINEGANDQKEIGFDNLNGLLKIYLKYQETDGYDTMKPVSEPDAEIRLSLADKDLGLMWYYKSADYEEDREKLLQDIRDAADDFDKKIKDIMLKRNFQR